MDSQEFAVCQNAAELRLLTGEVLPKTEHFCIVYNRHVNYHSWLHYGYSLYSVKARASTRDSKAFIGNLPSNNSLVDLVPLMKQVEREYVANRATVVTTAKEREWLMSVQPETAYPA